MTTSADAAAHDLRAATASPEDVVALFDGLAPGARATVTLRASAAGPALKALQAGRKGLFEWSVLGTGDPVAVELFRRDAPPGARREITQALAWDHDRLDDVERAAFEARERADFARASELWSVFETGLSRHIGFEEALLFPEFERRLGFPSDAGPTAVMRAEHRQIEPLLAAIAAEIGADDPRADSSRAHLHALLGDHNLKEEQILYPHADRAMNATEADGLVAAIQAF